ncbi:hypothetical protein Q9R19_01350 [Microbacterium sp. ARD32]|uniref:hypothetical protein n=1 Tax=Microbacterium sp. ARD32 TaxID=2962577 RepID=UPI0028823229|nr:hypothetical protein [Microbacterium sp. ARD32]MDT0156262.1 hypothetical protein [Microbacterium sp. ARD32]
MSIADVSAGGTLFVVFTCEGSGAVDITVRDGHEDIMHVWNEQCAPDVAYGGESAPFKTESNRLTMVIEATPGVRYSAVIEGAPPAPID